MNGPRCDRVRSRSDLMNRKTLRAYIPQTYASYKRSIAGGTSRAPMAWRLREFGSRRARTSRNCGGSKLLIREFLSRTRLLCVGRTVSIDSQRAKKRRTVGERAAPEGNGRRETHCSTDSSDRPTAVIPTRGHCAFLFVIFGRHMMST